MRWNFHVSPSRTIVWPALLPPWKRTTASACSASRSTTLPLPSSPHWAPTITMPGIGCECRGRLGPAGVPRRLVRRAGVVAEQRDELAHLLQARDGALADLVHEILALLDVRREDHGALLLVAGVDERVELLEDPRAALLGTDVVDVQEVDAGEPVEQLGVGVLGVVVERAAQLGEQPRQGVDRDRAPRLEGLARDDHRERRLAGAHAAEDPQPATGVEVLVDAPGEVAHDARRRAGHVRDGRRVEGREPVAPRDDAGQAARLGAGDPAGAAAAVTGGVGLLVDEEAGPVAEIVGAAQSEYRSPA